MASHLTPVIQCAVEGYLDAAVVSRLVLEAGGRVGTLSGLRGKQHLRRQLCGYNNAARLGPWIVLVDLDADAECAPPLCASWLPSPSPLMCFRVAVREVEAWLLADRAGFAEYLEVEEGRIPARPETLERPKEFVVGLARRSRSRSIRERVVPRPGSGRPTGPLYADCLVRFVEDTWSPGVAASRSPSLRRCRERLRSLVKLEATRLRGES